MCGLTVAVSTILNPGCIELPPNYIQRYEHSESDIKLQARKPFCRDGITPRQGIALACAFEFRIFHHSSAFETLNITSSMTVGYFICRAGTQIPHMMYGVVNTTAKELFSGSHKTGLSAWEAATSHKSPCLLTAVQAHIARPFPTEFAHFFLAESPLNLWYGVASAYLNVFMISCTAVVRQLRDDQDRAVMMTFGQTREALVFTVLSVVSGVAKGFSADITPIIGEVSGVVSALLRLSPSEHKQY
ncbi:hypothetical protein C8J57DRAFT_1212683 [Mycena rebaudengoi]|nr:hypothetical protein C8J57DRAFT_1212683 [Mycena rebaudengoi]